MVDRVARATLVRHMVGERGIVRRVEVRRDSLVYQRASFPSVALTFRRLVQVPRCVVDSLLRTLLSREADHRKRACWAPILREG